MILTKKKRELIRINQTGETDKPQQLRVDPKHYECDWRNVKVNKTEWYGVNEKEGGIKS